MQSNMYLPLDVVVIVVLLVTICVLCEFAVIIYNKDCGWRCSDKDGLPFQDSRRVRRGAGGLTISTGGALNANHEYTKFTKYTYTNNNNNNNNNDENDDDNWQYQGRSRCQCQYLVSVSVSVGLLSRIVVTVVV